MSLNTWQLLKGQLANTTQTLPAGFQGPDSEVRDTELTQIVSEATWLC